MLDATNRLAELGSLSLAPGIGLQVHHWEQGKPVVLVPGWPLADEAFDRQMSELARTGVSAVSVSLVGFEQTAHPSATYHYYIFAESIAAITSYLDLEAVPLGLLGIGGAIAVHYTAESAGQRITRLALFGAPASTAAQADLPGGSCCRLGQSNGLLVRDLDRPGYHAGSGQRRELTPGCFNSGAAAWFISPCQREER